MEKKTPDEIDQLKARWLADPYWVLENTEGFEAYRAELRQFRISLHEQEEKSRNGMARARDSMPDNHRNPE